MSKEQSAIDHTRWTGSTVESLVAAHTPEVRGKNFRTKQELAEFFGLPEDTMSESMAAYSSAFMDLVTRQLVLGHFKYRAFRGLDSREKQLRNSEGVQGLMTGRGFPHEVRHALVSLALSENKESLRSLIPLFQKVGPMGFRFFSLFVPPKTKKRLSVEEVLVTEFLEMRHLQRTLHTLPSEVFARMYLRQNAAHPLLKKFLDSFRNYPADEKLLWNFFVGATAPLMRKHAPEAAEKLLGSATPRRPTPRGSVPQGT